MNTIAIMGGSFNPIHNGHVSMAKAAYEQFPADKVLFMPSYNPSSYKDISEMVSASDRCRMVELAISDYPYMELSTLEIERGGRTYTADTLAQLDGVYDYIYFIIGADSLYTLDRWYKPDYVMNHCHFLVANRDEQPSHKLMAKALYLKEMYDARIDFIKLENIPISSSLIRERLACGLSVEGLVPDSVNNYIIKNHLYNKESL